MTASALFALICALPRVAHAGPPPVSPSIIQLSTSSVTVSWGLPGPTSGYIVEASTISGFTGLIYSSATASQSESTLTLPGLSANTTYYLRVGALYPPTTAYAITTPTHFSTLANVAGSGIGSASVVPFNISEGIVTVATVTFAVPPQGMSVGGQIELVLPAGWQLTNPFPGSLVVTSTAAATFSVNVLSSQQVNVKLTSGFLTGGTLIQIGVQNLFTNCNLMPGSLAFWVVRSAMNTGDLLAPIAALPSQTVVKGPSRRLVYVPWTPLNVSLNQPSAPILLQVVDSCGQPVPLSAAVAVTLKGVFQDQISTDTGASFSTASDFSSTTTLLNLPAASTVTVFYYENSNPGSNLGIKAGYGAPLDPLSQPILLMANVRNSSFTFKNPSVDNGTAVSAQTSMTLSPDGDGVNDLAYIHFSPSDNSLQWHVVISSDNFNSVVFDRWGIGDPQASLAWDGRDMRNGTIAPNAPYSVKLEVPGLAVNTSLSIILYTAMISGKVTVGGVPGYQAFVNANPTSGTGYSQGLTDVNGNYALYGLRSGTSYNLYASLVSTATQANISGTINNVTAPAANQNFALATPGIVRVSVVVPSAAASTVYGSVNLYVLGANQNYWGNIRLQGGATISDNGDYFNSSSWTVMGVAPGSYTLHLNLSGYGIPDHSVDVTANATVDVILNPAQQASIYGKITLPAAATVNEWVSVQATPLGSQFPTAYGGASFNLGQTTAIYSIFAVPSGSYTITAQVPNLVPQSTQAVVGAVNIGDPVNGGLDFGGFTAGNTISGSITVTGDTSGQSNPFTLWINAYNPKLGLNAFTQVQLTPNPNSTQTNYSLGGLANGTYQIFPPYLPGFDTSPPGSQNVTVSGGATTLNLVLTQNTGEITGNIKLPLGQSDYNNVHLSLQGPISQEADVTGAPPYHLKYLNTGFYYLVATYRRSGAQVAQNVAVTNGQAQTIDLDLGAQTFAATGSVSIQSGFSMVDTNGSLVTVNTVGDLLAAATTQVLTLGGTPQYVGTTFTCAGGVATTTTTARVEAFPKNFNNFDQANRNGLANCFGVGQYKYGTIAADGSFSIPQLYPGLWELDVYPYFDNGTTPNVSVLKQTISITNVNPSSVSFALNGGNNVSGTVNLPTGVSDTHAFNLQVVTDRGDTVMTQPVSIGSQGNPANSAPFTIDHLAAGNYSLLAVDPGTYDSTTGHTVISYVAQPLQITLTGGDLTGQTITLAAASRIIGKIAIQGTNPDRTPSLTLVTPANSYLLSSNFSINAQANPWVPGGFANAAYGSNGIAIDANNQFSIEGLLSGTYDVRFQQFTYGNASQGSMNLAAYTQGAVAVPPSQTVDLGTITLLPGISLSGNVTDATGNALSNIRVRAQPSNSQHGNDSIETFTNSNGDFTFAGLNPFVKTYDFTAAPRPSPGENVLPVPYGQVKRLAIDVTQSPTLKFSLPPATASLSGKVLKPPNGQPLSYPESDQQGYPAAAIYVFLHGDTTVDNPLGTSNATDLDGTFSIPFLQAGVYDITIESLGYKPVRLTNITLTDDTNKDLGTTTLQTGPILNAALAKPDGSAVNTKDVRTAVAASNDLGSIIFGQVNSDANTGNILSVKFAGFDLSPKTYTVLFFDSRDNVIVPPEGKGLVFGPDSDNVSKSLTYTPTAPLVLSGIQKTFGDVDVTFYFSRPLRNSAIDQAPSSWLSLDKGLGVISGVILSGDRRQLQFVYTPAAGEQNAVVSFSAHTVDIDPSTHVEFVISKTVTLLLGQKATAEQNINPALGGSVSLSDNQDPTHINIPANAFLNSDGTSADATTSYALTLSATDDAGSVGAGIMKGVQRVAQMMAMGERAYLSECYRAMQTAKASAAVNPLSSFYSVLLPQGLSHSLNQTSFLTLTYDAHADPNQINVYFYNGTEYLIEQNLRTVDTVNHTITVGVSHFSTFVVLENSQPVIVVGAASSGGSIDVFNFPNPFDLQTKTKTLNRGGTTATLTTDGTIIRYFIPAGLVGASHIDIFNVVGEKVRSIDLGTPAGDTYNYVAWDGKNDSGNKVASGVYIGELKSGGSKAFWKMAVIK